MSLFEDDSGLAKAAVGVIGTYLLKAAGKLADGISEAAGKKVLEWVRSKLEGSVTGNAVAGMEANPESRGAQKMLEGALLAYLEKTPESAEELATLLREAEKAGYSIYQKLTQSGDRNIAAQIAGNGSQVSVTKG